MNLPNLLATFEKIDPTGFRQANASLTSLAMSAGAHLTLAQVQHVTANLKELPAFLSKPAGREAVKAFVEAWQASGKVQ